MRPRTFLLYSRWATASSDSTTDSWLDTRLHNCGCERQVLVGIHTVRSLHRQPMPGLSGERIEL